mgnify:CR=1 FL=1
MKSEISKKMIGGSKCSLWGRFQRQTYSKIYPFYMVGGMGHSAMVTLGVCLNNKKQNICYVTSEHFKLAFLNF